MRWSSCAVGDVMPFLVSVAPTSIMRVYWPSPPAQNDCTRCFLITAHCAAGPSVHKQQQPVRHTHKALVFVFYRHSAPTASSANTIPSPFHARSSSTQPSKTTHSSRFTGPSAANSAHTASFAKTTTPPSRARSVAAHFFTISGRVTSNFS